MDINEAITPETNATPVSKDWYVNVGAGKVNPKNPTKNIYVKDWLESYTTRKNANPEVPVSEEHFYLVQSEKIGYRLIASSGEMMVPEDKKVNMIHSQTHRLIDVMNVVGVYTFGTLNTLPKPVALHSFD